MWGIIWSFISSAAGRIFGGNVVNTILQDITNVINQSNVTEQEKNQLIADVTLKYLDAQMQMANIRAQSFGKWSIVMALLFIPGPALWWSSVFLVSTFPNLFPGYQVLALPPDFYPWMTSILGALFFTPVIGGVLNKTNGIPTLFGSKQRILTTNKPQDTP